MKLLFLGNSATYVHEIPQMLQRLAGKVGYSIEVGQLTPGGCTLAQHADASSAHGKRVLAEIAKGYDVVFLQENSICISNEEYANDCRRACSTLGEAVRQSSAQLWLYVRPPVGYENFGMTTIEQCRALDALFLEIAKAQNATCVFVNRAFAHAAGSLPFDLWGKDHAHTSEHGAYLAVCVFFATLFGKSASCLDADGVSAEDARALQEIADKVVLEGARIPD